MGAHGEVRGTVALLVVRGDGGARGEVGVTMAFRRARRGRRGRRGWLASSRATTKARTEERGEVCAAALVARERGPRGVLLEEQPAFAAGEQRGERGRVRVEERARA